jgi:hypothetical protein
MLRLLFAALALVVVSSQGLRAQEFAALTGKIAPGRCHMDYCSWFSIESAEALGEAPHGVLFKLDTKWFSSHHPRGYDRPAPRKFDNEGTSYVFCSKTKPALLSQSDDKKTWTADFLAPGNRQEVFGANETALAYYWAACHRAIVKDVYDEGARLGQKLGYRIGKAADSIDKIADPKVALTW